MAHMEYSVHVGLAVAAAVAVAPPPSAPSSHISSSLAVSALVSKPQSESELAARGRQGTLLSSAGPGALPAGGSILEDPDLVWTEVSCSSCLLCYELQ